MGSENHVEISKEFNKYKFKCVVPQVTQTDRLALYLGKQMDLKLEWDSYRLEEEFRKYKFKRVVAQVSQTDRFVLYLGIRVDLKLKWDL
ncbi:uncharacterized protein G2W53_033564 [Senna tora]|uniref:Uncharacterized protein n=1 Tax=Senna tora TaxID=362788 RepID=A0A834SXR7_9FABA|nr:uncharacterized protein G2W53_033564 [Senna tora]